ncbi:unnamed protein product [Dibothriocephalus latus]|uniref:Uncharacterized protein n=1 Tax=Dibothriocephalus latus TaxID=60516 RepID=A0A3P7LX60_DIBLA|nr:unnamed protein product [Dibothriocephalus latus]
MREAIPEHTAWIKDTVAAIDPPAKKVITAAGKEVGRLFCSINSYFYAILIHSWACMKVNVAGYLHLHPYVIQFRHALITFKTKEVPSSQTSHWQLLWKND